LKPMFFQTNAHLLICVDERCAARNSRVLFRHVWNALEAEGLAYYQSGGNLRLSHSGCLGACSFGPTVTCYFKRDGVLREAWYHGMNMEHTLTLARALHRDQDLPREGRYDE
jgi:(2Fe-2S) ferredoxin